MPLSTTIYSDTEKALKFLTSGRHIGKVLIDMRGAAERDELDIRSVAEDKHDEESPVVPATNDIKPKLSEFKLDKSGLYLVTGGLGSLGIEVRNKDAQLEIFIILGTFVLHI